MKKWNELISLFCAFTIIYSIVTIFSLSVLSVLPYLKIYFNNILLLPESSIPQIFTVVFQTVIVSSLSVLLFTNKTIISFFLKIFKIKPVKWAFLQILK
jgi:hypothetical protein